ncbi:MAG: hypothetical protein GF346_07205 [Candidatus Eisenbacteria bacterium]|nr:hypothetical protein [Candidatus Latescibacterota bacterium]MBD3302218.1 hypothetical protein [Candidatus Eisenbacteria bacterium]
MIRVRLEDEVREFSYEEFIRAIQEGRVQAETPVSSEILTSGDWKQAGQLQFFRSWAPPGSVPEESPEAEEKIEAGTETERGPEPEPESEPDPVAGVEPEPERDREAEPTEKPAPPERESERLEPEPPEPGPSAGDPIPWEMGDRLGITPRAIWTVALAFREVDDFFRRIARGVSVFPALTFGLLIYAIASLVEAIYGALLWAGLGDNVREFLASVPGAEPGMEMPGAGDIFSSHGVAILFYPLFAFLWSWVVHLFLRMFGNPARGMTDTFRIVNYSIAPLVLTVIPICGNLIGWIWVVLLSVRGLIRNQEMEGSSALLAVLIPFVLIAGIYFFLVVRSFPGLGAAG